MSNPGYKAQQFVNNVLYYKAYKKRQDLWHPLNRGIFTRNKFS